MWCVSVLIATYNQEKYIYETIDSVLIQNYENIQIIIADDNSSYFEEDKIRNYIEKNKKNNIKDVVVIKNENNLGTVKNLNNARQFIRGDLVVPLSGDDVFFSEFTLANYVKAIKDDDTYDVLVSQVVHCDNTLSRVLYKCLNNKQIETIKSGNNKKIYGELCLGCFIPAVGCAYKTVALNKVGLYDETYELVEDWPTLLKMLREGLKFRFVDFISAKHRDGGVSHIKKRKADEREDRFHKDLMSVIENEIFPNYRFAEGKMQKKVYIYAYDRLLISDYRKNVRNKSIIYRIKWALSTKGVSGAFVRGCIRKMKIKIGEKA